MSVSDIKRLLKDERFIIGSRRVVKLLASSELEKVYLASNAPANLSADIERYAKLTRVELERLSVPNDELGTICKKPFNISCLGVKKQGSKRKK